MELSTLVNSEVLIRPRTARRGESEVVLGVGRSRAAADADRHEAEIGRRACSSRKVDPAESTDTFRRKKWSADRRRRGAGLDNTVAVSLVPIRPRPTSGSARPNEPFREVTLKVPGPVVLSFRSRHSLAVSIVTATRFRRPSGIADDVAEACSRPSG